MPQAYCIVNAKNIFMRILFKVFLWLLGIVALLAVIGFFLPKKVHVERTAYINAPPSVVYGYINDLKTYDQWMPWNKLDPNWKVVFGNTTTGKDAWYSWDSENKNVGKGKLTITESVPNQKVVTLLEFTGFSSSLGGWTILPKDSGTNITWYMDSDMGLNPVNRWFGVFFDKMMGPDFEKGLADLKQLSEHK